jgi:hypothetical protein
MKVRRNIASIPVRSAAETWQTIITLITGAGSVDVDSLTKAASVMESLIADEHPANVPIVLSGSGPRLVIYLLYNENAMEVGKDVDALSWMLLRRLPTKKMARTRPPRCSRSTGGCSRSDIHLHHRLYARPHGQVRI